MDIVMKGKGKNAIGTEMMDFLLTSLQKANGTPILLTGDGDAFSAGLNLKEVASLEQTSMEAFLSKFDLLAETLYTYPGPTVACVNGHAIAGGCVLNLCCDYRVAVDDTRVRIGLNEMAIGAVFPPRTLKIVRARLPARHVNAVILGADLYSPEDALRIGIVDEISSDALALSRHRLERLAAHPAAAYTATKRALTTLAPDPDLASQLRSIAIHWSGPEVKARLAVVLKK
jgi:enoyl-CoA hydratase/carnithine racemase